MDKLAKFIRSVVPDAVPYDEQRTQTQTRDELVQDVIDGTKEATMAVRLTYVNDIILNPSLLP